MYILSPWTFQTVAVLKTQTGTFKTSHMATETSMWCDNIEQDITQISVIKFS